jgi:Protein of unknown function (DUF2809)
MTAVSLLPRQAGLVVHPSPVPGRGRPPRLVAVLAAAACLALESLQLTEVNAYLLAVPALRWFLGTTFSWHDVGCYLLGVALALGLDAILLRPPRR